MTTSLRALPLAGVILVSLLGMGANGQDRVADPIDQQLGLKNITKMQVNIHLETGKTPPDRFVTTQENKLIKRSLVKNVVQWQAPLIEYQPLFFEDIALERYGQCVPYIQPGISGLHFFNGIFTLPIHATVESPFSRDYPLGYYRPGHPAPYLHYRLPW